MGELHRHSIVQTDYDDLSHARFKEAKTLFGRRFLVVMRVQNSIQFERSFLLKTRGTSSLCLHQLYWQNLRIYQNRLAFLRTAQKLKTILEIFTCFISRCLTPTRQRRVLCVTIGLYNTMSVGMTQKDVVDRVLTNFF